MQSVSEGLSQGDPEIAALLLKEKQRQKDVLNFIASENYASKSVLEALGSYITNKYVEGGIGSRYYPGCQVADEVEYLCQKRALDLYKLDPEIWGVNVQPLSGSPANFIAYIALLNANDRILSMNSEAGGHASHGCMAGQKKLSGSSMFFNTVGYGLKPDGTIDYDQMDVLANGVKPQLIIAGASRYARTIDFQRFRIAADRVGAILMVDMAHVAGMIAAGVFQSPFEFADVVTTTTHKTLRGPRSGIIFFRKDRIPDAAQRIQAAVYPGLQGGAHMNQIAAVTVCLKEATTPQFREYQLQVLRNANRIAESLTQLGYQPLTNGTDNHLVLVSLHNKTVRTVRRENGSTLEYDVAIDGARVEFIGDQVGILANRLPPIKSDDTLPYGARLGSAAMTTRGMKEDDITASCKLFDRCVKLAVQFRQLHDRVVHDEGLLGDDGERRQPTGRVVAVKVLEDYKRFVKQSSEAQKHIAVLKSEVEQLAHRFPVPALD